MSAFLAFILVVATAAQTPQRKPIPFDQFIRGVKAAGAQEFLNKPGSKIGDRATFDEMRQYILNYYRGVHVQHSYLAGSQTVDCVPINEQPSLRDGKRTIAKQPTASITSTPPQNAACPNGTIPISRITLEQLSHFKTLHDFLQKSPDGSEQVPQPGK